jgi:hypothetical protein
VERAAGDKIKYCKPWEGAVLDGLLAVLPPPVAVVQDVVLAPRLEREPRPARLLPPPAALFPTFHHLLTTTPTACSDRATPLASTGSRVKSSNGHRRLLRCAGLQPRRGAGEKQRRPVHQRRREAHHARRNQRRHGFIVVAAQLLFLQRRRRRNGRWLMTRPVEERVFHLRPSDPATATARSRDQELGSGIYSGRGCRCRVAVTGRWVPVRGETLEGGRRWANVPN